MFDGGVKETLCARCAHRDVCAHKQDYFDILKAVENATVTRDTGDGKITSKKVIHWLLFLCKGENYACQRSDKSGYSGCS